MATLGSYVASVRGVVCFHSTPLLGDDAGSNWSPGFRSSRDQSPGAAPILIESN